MDYVLLIDDEPEILEMLTMAAQVAAQDKIVACASGFDAMEKVKSLGAPKVVVTDFRMANGDGLYVFSEMKRLHPAVPLIVCSGNPLEELLEKFPGAYAHLNKPQFLKPLREKLDVLFKNEAKPKPKYVAVPLGYMLRLGVLDVDAYIKIGEDKYIKVHQTGDIFDKYDVEKLQKKNLDSLLVTEADARQILARFESFITSQLESKKLSADEKIEAAQDVLEASFSFAKAMGWNKETVAMANAAVAFTMTQVSKRKDWRDILKRAQGRSRYAQHISLLSLLTCVVAQGVGWSNEATQKKLVLAAMLHDFTISDVLYEQLMGNDPVVRKVILESPEYLQHPVKVAELARTLHDVPPDLDNILLQHHEKPDGSGFPRKLTASNIAPLSALFIICHDLVDFIAGRAVTDELVKEFWERNAELYRRDPFKKIILAMKQLETA